jgi:hypothetical protein
VKARAKEDDYARALDARGAFAASQKCVMKARMRTLRLIGYTLAVLVACFALYVAADVARSFYGADQYQQSLKRIPPNEIRVDDLRLLPKLPGNYRLRAQIHNLSPTYTLYSVRVVVTVDDCVMGKCQQQAEGLADLVGRAPPNQSATFFAEELILPALAQPLGERRLTSRVAYTRGGR